MQPPTLAEFIYSLMTLGKGIEPSKSYEHLVAKNREIPVYFKPFTLPENLASRLETTGDCHDLLLRELSYSQEHFDEVGFGLIVGDHPRYCLEMYRYLMPETTMANESSECKGLAVLAVAAHRCVGAPARFFSPRSSHSAYEEFVDPLDTWESIDPLTEMRCLPKKPYPAGYDEYYEKILELGSEDNSLPSVS